uniref:RNA-directed DNA polymerase n=1 Tax=Strongyloides papillosus TaxID=174720 RepID=A0A0N5BYB2_STREA
MPPRDYRLIAYLEDNMPIVCVADSGSHISLIRENRAKLNGFDSSTKEKFNAKCANSTPLPLEGKVKVNISLAKDLTLSFPFAVVSDDQFPDALSSILLGSDFFAHTNASIDYSNHTIRVCDRMFNLLPSPEPIFYKDEHPDKPCRLLMKPPENKQHFSDLIEREFSDIISKHPFDVGKSKIIAPEIVLTSNELPHFKRYLPPVKFLDDIDRYVEQLILNDIAEPDNEVEFTFNLVTALKKDKSLRLCLDVRPLNQIMASCHYQTPTFRDIVQKLAGGTYFSNIDLTNSFFQIEMPLASQKKLGFRTRRGTFRMKRLPFGLKVSPPYFQKNIEAALSHLNCTICYLDDILVVTKSNIVDHYNEVRQVLRSLRQSGFKINIAKCTFCSSEIVFLSYIFNSFGYKPHCKNIVAIKNIKPPTDVSQVRMFLGAVNYFRSHIYNAAKVEEPLTDLLRKDSKFCWTPLHQKSFDAIKTCLEKAPFLSYPYFNEMFYLYTDASTTSYGAVLTQQRNGVMQPLGFFSKKIKPHKSTLPPTHLELRAISAALTFFSNWLMLQKITIYTDHKCLPSLILKNDDPKLYKFISNINFYSPVIKWIPGKNNVVADMLSRLPSDYGEKHLFSLKREGN